jgi:cysteine synthase
MDLVDDIVSVSDEDAEAMARRLARVEGVLGGVSSGANVVAALRVAQDLTPGSRVVTIVVDTGLKYLREGLYG